MRSSQANALKANSHIANSLIANKVTEKDIRDWLDQQGYQGRSARFHELELHAIKRPGFLQVFRFQVEATDNSTNRSFLYGVVRDDERYSNGQTILCFEDEQLQKEQLIAWSEGLFQPRSRRSRTDASNHNSWGLWLILGLLLVAPFMIFMLWLIG